MSEKRQWLTVDEGWGHRVVDFATLSEPGNVREYAALHALLGLHGGDHLLDVACGSGLAIELATVRGARCAGIDASARLIEVARDRCPDADLRTGDMCELPWESDSFDVVTSTRGIWATTPEAVAEARRVLVPGGRLGITGWGHVKASAGAWALEPLSLAAPAKVRAQAALVALGRPGVGEALLADHGFTHIERHAIPFVWEFPDPETYARALASTGPAYEAISQVGEAAFLTYAVRVASARVREGLPLRAPINAVAFTAQAPMAGRRRTAASRASRVAVARHPERSRLGPAPTTSAGEALAQQSVAERGYVMNAVHIWAHDPAAHDDLFRLLDHCVRVAGLSRSDRGVLVCATAGTIGDPYCSLAWGTRLAGDVGAEVAAQVLAGDDTGLDPRAQALAAHARALTGRRPVGPSPDATLTALRDNGFSDQQILAVSLYAALRQAFSSVNAGLGAVPDVELVEAAPALVRATASP